MIKISSSTALDRPIVEWLAHQRALGRDYANEERVLDSLRWFVARFHAPDCKIACNIDPLRGVFASNSDPL